MASKPDHLERTADEPRESALHTVILEHVDEANPTTRVFRLRVPEGSGPIRFMPGQWLDVYVPGIEKAGGFTITSTPRDASSYLELAVQKSPNNPPAAWLWRDIAALLGASLRVRVGGSFVWPPPSPHIDARALRRVVFVAGGVGVNPLVAMLCSLSLEENPPPEVHFFYSLKDTGNPPREARNMLFLERIAGVFREGKVRGRLRVFLTGGDTEEDDSVIACRGDRGGTIPFHARRCTVQDVDEVLGDTPVERQGAVVYVCGVPTMTDEFVARLTDREDGLAMEPHRVLCEKWW